MKKSKKEIERIKDGRLAKALKDQFVSLLRNSFGNVSNACEFLSVPRHVYLHWLENDDHFRLQVADVMETVDDLVENKMIEQALNGDTALLIHYSKTKLKHRGYGEKSNTEAQATVQVPVQVNVTVVQNRESHTVAISESRVEPQAANFTDHEQQENK